MRTKVVLHTVGLIMMVEAAFADVLGVQDVVDAGGRVAAAEKKLLRRPEQAGLAFVAFAHDDLLLSQWYVQI